MSQFIGNNNNFFNTFNSLALDDDDDESKILAWLSPLEPWVRHRDIAEDRIDSVGGWVLETEEFRRWHNGSREDGSDHAALFCHGNPGAGKSYITSLVIDKLCDEAEGGDTAVVCFYFDFAARDEQSPLNVLGSLLRQIVSGLDKIPEVVVRSFRKQKKAIGDRSLQVSGILKMFQTITATERTLICVDALDECVPEHRMVILESLGQILQGSPNTRIFMTGRSHIRSEVEWKLEGAATFVSIQPTEDGLIRYLREKLRNDTTRGIMSATLEADIMRIIPEISSETFLLASLHIEAILRETTIARRGKRLKSVEDGAGLGDAYGVTLERIKSQDEEKTRLVIASLTWICYSERPLEVDELCHALGVEVGATDFDPENVPLIDTLLGCCQGLITVNKETFTVRLIHYTAQEYLCAHSALFDNPHSIISETCLTYLNSQQVRDLSTLPLPDHQSAPFLKYSSRYWGTHANRELSNHARTLALELLSRYEAHVSAVSLLQQLVHPRYIGDIGTSPLFSGLHCASFFGIVDLVTTLVKGKCCEINREDCIGSTPLSWASRNGHEQVVSILLEQENIDPNRQDGNGRAPLGCSAVKGHEGVVKLLLERDDVDPNCPDENDQTPLGCAAGNGHGGVVKLLLARDDVNPDRPGENDQTPLWCAAENGHEGVVGLLLVRDDVDPNRSDKVGWTPLGCAAVKGHEGVVKLLLERGDVNPGKPNRYGQTPLFGAAQDGQENVVKILLERDDINPNKPDNRGQIPLYRAAWNKHEGVVKILLGRGDTNPDKPDVYGQTPLFGAAMNGCEGVVKILLERDDVNPGKTNRHGQTPLFGAVWDGHEGVVKILLGRDDVSPHRPDSFGRTPLWWAAKSGHAGVVGLLQQPSSATPSTV